MGQKKKKLAKGRLDKFYYMAKEQGYRSRAAFKLIQLNKKYNFLGSAKACLDLCAAPGGWMQVASKYMPVQSVIVGVDLVPIRQVRNCISLAEDITTQKCRTEIKKALKTWKVDVCLHDGAPNMGTSWVQDAYQQAELTLHALKLATEFLTTGGWFVTKVFRGADYNSLIWVFNKLFKKVESTKPPSSRNASAEIFVVCQGYLNPKRIDPKLLDPKFVFKEIIEGPKKVDILSDKKQKRNRSGYEDGVNQLSKQMFVSDFIESTEHLRDLASHNSIVFDLPKSQLYLDHPETTEEIVECLKDLKVLGKNDFSKIIKWRKAMATHKEEIENPKKEEEQEEEEKRPLTQEEMDENLDKEIKELMENVEKKKRREKKKANEKKRDQQKRVELKMHIPGDKIEEGGDGDLFSVKGKDAEYDDDDQVAEHTDLSSDDDDSEYENDDEQDFDRDEYMEQELEGQYKQYLQRIRNRAVNEESVEKVSKDKLTSEDRDLDDEEFADADDESEQEEESHPLLVGNKRKEPSTEKTTSMWFDNDIFGGVEYRTEDDDEEEDQDQEDNKPIILTRNSKVMKAPVKSKEPAQKKQKSDKYQSAPGAAEIVDDEDVQQKEVAGFEEVPVEEEVEYSSESEEEEDDKIKTLALGQFLLRKKSKQDLIDNAYNRRVFNETNLPVWFTDDENKHNKPQTPLTKEMVQEIRRKMKEIDSRPIKKIAEAKARKKFRLSKKLDKAREKANSIVDNPEMSGREKTRAIEKLYKGTDKKSKNQKIVMIAKKSRTAGGGTGKYKMVDKRMKKEMRSMKNKEKTKGRGKSGSSGGKGKSKK
ncbi:hypothetical protein CYY_008247 [Polysphondylium violaceum]|uniref:Putative rRNA methyltransferase n=1 Tax=Polysphondylium violaceum TaxID=133409 RepID=A0A8J4PVK3_9MYCE|nr:hypothetical protein CYY_008247 [Polysphondylium violaceum]